MKLVVLILVGVVNALVMTDFGLGFDDWQYWASVVIVSTVAVAGVNL